MNHKIILLSFCATVLGSMTVYGYNCPPLPKGWNGNMVEWQVSEDKIDPNFKTSEYPIVEWVAYDAWILQKAKYQLGSFQCNYKGYINNKYVVKITLGYNVKSPEKYEFKGGLPQVINNYNKNGNVGAKCKPNPNSSFYKFPPECEIVERLTPLHPSEMGKEKQENKIHTEESEKHHLQNQKK